MADHPWTVVLRPLNLTGVLAPGLLVLCACGAEPSSIEAAAAEDDATDAEALVVSSGNLIVAREMHAAVALADGRVAVVGGNASVGGASTASTEVYAPASGTWSAGPSLSTAFFAPAAARLPDGRVLVLGGASTAVDRLDFTAMTNSPAAPLPASLDSVTLTTLQSGDVLAIGANFSAGLRVKAARYAPATNTWTAVPDAPLAMDRHGAALLADGRVLVVSGTQAAIFNPATTQWTSAQNLLSGRDRPRLVRLPDGRVAAFGTSCGASNERALDVYNPSTNVWSTLGTLSNAHNNGVGLMLADNKTLLLAGGDGCPGPMTTSTVELFDTQFGYFTTSDYLTQDRTLLTATALLDGRVLFAGGRYSQGFNSGVTNRVDVRVTPGPVVATYSTTYKAPRCAYPWTSCSTGTLVVGRGTVGNEPNRPNTLAGTCADGNIGTFHSDESVDAVRVISLDGAPGAAGKQVRVEVDVWAWAGYTSDKLDIYVAGNADAPAWSLVTTLTPTKAGAGTLSTTLTLPSGGLSSAVRAQFRYGGTATACTAGSYNDHDDVVLGLF